MKKNTLLGCLALLVSINVSTQILEPQKSTIEHNNKIRTCLLVRLDPEPKTLKNAWIDFLKKEYDFKLKGMGWFSDKDLLYAEKVTIPKLSSKNLDFYTNIIEDENGSEMKVFASLGYDIYLNEEQYRVEFDAMKAMLVLFLKDYLPEYYNKGIYESAVKIKKLNNEIRSLKDNIARHYNSIEKLNKEVINYKTSVEENSIKLKAAEIKLRGRQDKLIRIRTKLQQL